MTITLVKADDDMLGYRDLYESQQRGVDHLYDHNFTQFVAPMGYGKTVVAMTAIGELIVDEVIDCALVIAPKRVAEIVWPGEQKLWKHLGFLRVRSITGDPAERARKLHDGNVDIYVIGIDHVPWLVSFLKTLPKGHRLFQCLVIDELSKLKAPRGKWSRELRKVASLFRMRWGLTGTPRPNGYIDQFAPLSIISANKIWGKLFDPWREEHFRPVDYQRHDWVVRDDHIPQLEADIAKFTATVDNSDMPDLPELVVRDHWIDLPPTVMGHYRDMEKELVVDDIVAANAGVATIKLAQLTQGFLYSEEDVTGRCANYVHGVKEALLEEMVNSLDGEPVLIVYEFQEDIRRMLEKWPDMRWFGINTTQAQGATNVADWNAGAVPIMALHPAAAGHGLNLQKGGCQMIWYGMTWSPELYEQTIARIHRQGQERHCFVHRILARHTIDEAKVLRVETKISAQEAFKQHLRRA